MGIWVVWLSIHPVGLCAGWGCACGGVAVELRTTRVSTGRGAGGHKAGFQGRCPWAWAAALPQGCSAWYWEREMALLTSP